MCRAAQEGQRCVTSAAAVSSPLYLKVVCAAASTAKPPDLTVCVKIASSSLSTRVVQDMIVQRTFDLLRDDFELHRFSIAYPELVVSPITQLRAFAKKTRVTRWVQVCVAQAHPFEYAPTLRCPLPFSDGERPRPSSGETSNSLAS